MWPQKKMYRYQNKNLVRPGSSRESQGNHPAALSFYEDIYGFSFAA